MSYKPHIPSSVRVRLAMRRISRDRWVPPEEYRHLVVELSKCAAKDGCYNYSGTLRAATNETCAVVGMFRGDPLVPLWHPLYSKLLDGMRKVKRKNTMDASIEILLLEAMTKGAK